MAAGTLYTNPENFRATKILVAAQYAGAAVKVAPNFVFGETNKTDAFLKKFPSSKVPAFEASNGKVLSDSNAIAYYVAGAALKGSNDFEKAEVLQWISFAETEVLPPACAWYFPVLGIMPYNKQSFDRAREDMKQVLGTLNTHLATRTFLVGERVSLADITVASALLNVYREVLDPAYRAVFTNTNRWFLTVVNQPKFRAVLNTDVVLCTAVAVVDPKKYQQVSGSGDKKKEQPQQQQPKKKEEKKPAPKKEEEPVEEMDAAEAALAEEPKSKDPFSTMPKGTFDFDDFKRCYSNEDEKKSVPYFLEKFDPEHYSIWFGEYKYNDELSKVFMSCNLITGMFQRLDKMRKQAFASVCLFGDDNNSTISGIWVWRGHDLAFTLSPDWQIDYEVYDWKKLDAKTEETKKLVTQYFSWTGTDSKGRKFNQGKIFK